MNENANMESVGVFNKKYFNKVAFGKYSQTIPQKRLNLLIKSGILTGNKEIRETLANQTGSAYAVIPMTGRLHGKPVNYDGKTRTDKGKTLPTYKRGVVVIGRKDKFEESDFTYDVTSGVKFMDQIAVQLRDYWDESWEDVILKIVEGIFSMTSQEGKKFIQKHTFDITKETNPNIQETTLNDALKKACGDRRRNFTLSIANSEIVTNLENKKLITNMRYNDANGIERELNLYTWNGKVLIEYDDITEIITGTEYKKTTDTSIDETKTYYTKDSDGNYIEVIDSKVADIGNYYEVSKEGEKNYVTYAFGKGVFDYEPAIVKTPYETDRDADIETDYLITRERKVIAPHGISYTMKNQVTDSPTDEELSDGANWDIVMGSDGEAYDHREIAIARIISKG